MIPTLLTRFAVACPGGSFLGFPTWYEYLDGKMITLSNADGTTTNQCLAQITKLGDVWLILAAVIEILLRVSALVAIGFIIYGGITLIASEGQPDRTAKSIKLLISAAIGLAISVGSAVIVAFIAGRFH